MQINGKGGVEGEEEGVDIITPFLTPQHLATTPAQSYFSVLNSQESVDLYHDAYASLQRPPYNHLAKAERRRHASMGATTRENGTAVEMDLVDNKKTNGVLPRVAVGGRARHASCNTTSPVTYTNLQNSYSHPYHIGHLSLSTNSLKKKIDREQPSRKMGSLQKIGEKNNWDPNYMPFVEMEVSESGPGARVQEVSLTPGMKAPHTDKSRNSDICTWKRNYVQCVEVDRLLGRIDEGDGPHFQQEIQLRPEHIEHSKETIVQMYTFGPHRICDCSSDHSCKGHISDHSCNGHISDHSCNGHISDHSCSGHISDHSCSGHISDHSCSGHISDHSCSGHISEHVYAPSNLFVLLVI